MEKLKDTISIAPFGKRVGAFALDFLMLFACYLTLLYTLGTNVLSVEMGAKQDTIDFFDYAVSSRIYEYTDEGHNAIQIAGTNQYAILSSAGEKTPAVYPYFYESAEYFFSSFCANDSRIDRSETQYGKQYFFETILKLPSKETVVSLAKEDIAADESKLYGESAYYRYAITSEGLADTSSVVLQNKHQEILSGDDETKKSSLINSLNSYFYGDSDSIFVTASNVLTSQSYYKTLSKHSQLVNWAIRAICYLPFSFAFFFLLPLVFKNGQTLGKLINGICLIGNDGYQVKIKNKLIRSSFMFVLVSIYVIAPLSTLYLVFALFFVAMVDYIITMGAKNEYRLSLEDRLAKTVVISKKNSVIYPDASFEEGSLSTKGAKEIKNIEDEEPVEVLDMDSINRAREEAREEKAE